MCDLPSSLSNWIVGLSHFPLLDYDILLLSMENNVINVWAIGV